jgi:FSR family fosmidomycin resistance protein-like MFS transporter
LGATPFQLGIISSAGGLAGAAISVPTGWFADRRNIKMALLLGMIPLIIGTLLFAIASDWMIIIPAMILVTIAFNMGNTTCPMICGSCLKSEERAMGMQLCDTFSAIPCLVSPIIGAIIISGFGGIGVGGIRPLYYVQVVGFLFVLLIMVKMFTSPERLDRSPTTSFVEGMREVFRQGSVVKRWILYMSFSAIPTFINSAYIPLYAAEVKAADQFVLGGMATASMVVPLLLSLLVGHWADIVGRKKVIYVMTLLYCSSLLLLMLSSNAIILLISAILYGFFMLGMVVQYAMSAELVPTHLLGRWYGILGMFSGIIGIVAPVVGGLIWDSIGPTYVLVFLIMTELVAISLLIRIPETLKKQKL